MERNATQTGDIGRRTGTTTGFIKNCKVGDCTIELGADSQFAGESLVVEAKEDASYDLKKALDEIDTGRRNRGADVGIFVFSRKTAPPHLRPLDRHGRDIIVIWDADDPVTDVYFDAALTLARALIFEHHRGGAAKTEIDFAKVDKVVEALAKRADQLELHPHLRADRRERRPEDPGGGGHRPAGSGQPGGHLARAGRADAPGVRRAGRIVPHRSGRAVTRASLLRFYGWLSR